MLRRVALIEGAICVVRTPELVITLHRIVSVQAGAGVGTDLLRVTDRKQS